MELVIARARRFDRFQEPDMGQVELPAELQHKLVWLVAASLRHYIVQHHGLAAVDGMIEEAGSALIAGHDEGDILESRAMRLARRLQPARPPRRRAARAHPRRGHAAFVHRRRARRSAALDYAAAWEVIADPRGRGPAILLRAAGVEREAAAAILLLANSRGPLVSGAEGDATAAQLELYDSLDRGQRRGGAPPVARRSRLSRRRRPGLDPRPPVRGGGMSSAPDIDSVAGRVDAEGRLIAADPPLAALHEQAGGSDGGMLAVPQIAALARLARGSESPSRAPPSPPTAIATSICGSAPRPRATRSRSPSSGWSERPAARRRAGAAPRARGRFPARRRRLDLGDRRHAAADRSVAGRRRGDRRRALRLRRQAAHPPVPLQGE